ELEVRTPRLGQGLSRAVGVERAGGQYEVTFQARALSGSERLGYALQNGASLDVVTGQAVVSTRWRQLQVRWRPPADAKFARFYVWPAAPAAGFLLRDISVVARPPGATTASRFTLDTRLKGSFYAYLVAQRQEQQRRAIDSRLFAVGASLSAFATQPLRGIGWGRFVSYSSAHGRYGDLPTHDEYLRFLAELGAIGALLLAFVVAVVAVSAWNGARNELGIAIAGMLATGALALVFINGLVAPDVMMPLAFAAAVACARAGVRPPVPREAGSWWPLPDRLRRGQPEAGQDQDPAANRDAKPALTPGSPSPPRGYRPALDGLRGVSVVTIIAYHMTTSVPGGFLAVDIFFVLSGYLITSILLRELLRKGRIRLAEFWARRARRLLPAVMLLVLVCAFQIYHAGDVSAWALRRSDLLSTLFYYANWHFIATDQSYFAGFLGASPVRHTWTLAIEEQFYLVWPLVVFGAYRLARSTRLLAGVIAAGIVASAVAMVSVYSVENPSRAYFGTDARASSLLIGAGLALLVARRPGWLASARGGAIARWAPLPIAATTLAGFGLLSDTGVFYYHGGALIFAALVALAIFVVEAAPGGRMARVLSFLPLRWTGQISYGLYLWYWPVLVWSSGWLPGDGLLRKLAELAVIYAAAATSYYVLERPIREGRLPGLGLSRRRLAVAMPILLAAVAVVTVRLTTLPTASLSTQLAAVTPLACPQQTVIGPYSWCPRQIGEPGAPVVASIGDSTSQSLYPGMREAAKRRGWTYIEAAEGGCSSLPLLFVQSDQPQYVARAKRCVSGIRQVIRGVRARYRPDVWVLTDRWPLSTMVTAAGKPLAPTDPRRDALIEAALRSLLRQLTAGGAHVLFVPTPPAGEPVACALHKLATTTCNRSAFSERDPVTAELTRTVGAAVAGLRGVTLVGIADLICPRGGQCVAIIDGTVVRYDGIHFSGPFSRKLVPIILERAQRHGLSFASHRHE
ncbi:MAG: acyltransferase family protein, partial [Solirubrobacteraceae bacterium]